MALQRILLDLYAPIPGGADVVIVELINKTPKFPQPPKMLLLLDRTHRVLYSDYHFFMLCFENDPTGVALAVADGSQPVDNLAAMIPHNWAIGRTQTIRVASSIATPTTWGDQSARTILYFMSEDTIGYRR